MREGRELARKTKQFAIEHRGRSWFHLATTLAALVGAIVVTCMDLPWAVRLPVSFVAALLHVRLFVIYHDYQHDAIFEGSRLAGSLLWLYGLLTLAPSSVWKHTHDHHHRNNSRRFGTDSVGSYPVLSTDEYRRAGLGTRFFYRFSRHPLTILFGYVTVFFYGFCIEPLLKRPTRHLDAALSGLLHVGLVVWLFTFRPDVAILAVVFPSFIASALGSYLFYVQHNFPGVKLRPGMNWDHVFAALHSSSFLRTNPVMHWFTGNIGYHHIHHLNSRIPFYRLPEAMAANEELQSPGTTTLRPRDIARCFRLKLWDPEKDRFVSFGEARRARRAATARV